MITSASFEPIYFTLEYKRKKYLSMNDLLPREFLFFIHKELWDRNLQFWQVARRKCMAKSCCDVQKDDF